MTDVFPSGLTSYSLAGDPAAANRLPLASAAIDQMYVDGLLYSNLKAGASCRPPVLRIATPLLVPRESSSNFDCSHVRVPSPKATDPSTATIVKRVITEYCRRAIDNVLDLCLCDANCGISQPN